MLEFFKFMAQTYKAPDKAMSEDCLIFVLEYGEAPDLEAERKRLVALFDDGEGFALYHYDEEMDPDILLLQFDVVPDQSPSFLFQQAQDLTDALEIVSVTPEIPSAWEDFESRELETESFSAIYSALCESSADSPSDPLWAIKKINAINAKTDHGVTGADIIVAQPDTGVAAHIEIDDGAVDRAKGFNVFTNSANPIDPLKKSMKAPGHGTATSSAVSSRSSNIIQGSAPGATVAPIRCVNSVVLGSGSRVAKAINFAVSQDYPIITMSLGGPIQGRAFKRAINRAYDKHTIILAAAGNCVKFVTWPARNSKVIAVAGVDVNYDMWRGSCRGPQVDFAAPAENVHVARRQPDDGGATNIIGERGQGTSFAVALTAGVAALWLEKHGRNTLIDEAERRGIVLQELFRAAVQQTAHVPTNWDSDNLGTGVVDADELLGRPLSAIDTSGSISTESSELPARFVAEMEYSEFFTKVRDESQSEVRFEASFDPEPSRQLVEVMDIEPSTPNLITSNAGPNMPMEKLIQFAFGRQSSGLESASSMSPEAAATELQKANLQDIVDFADDRIQTLASLSPDGVDRDAQEALRAEIETSAEAIRNADTPADMVNEETRFGLEALVKLTGRPAIRVPDDPDDLIQRLPALGDWASTLLPLRNDIFDRATSVGRVDIDLRNGRHVHVGTGFVIGDGQILTNRHVLDAFCVTLLRPDGTLAYGFNRSASIVFDNNATDETKRFKITGLIAAGAHPIGTSADLRKLDAAILEVEPENEANTALPPALSPSGTALAAAVSEILTIGFPARPNRQSSALTDRQQMVRDRLDEIFGNKYGVKYFAPGEIDRKSTSTLNAPHDWVFAHEATTLGGNSGSPVFSMTDLNTPIGLHFAGKELTMNLSHDIFKALNLRDMLLTASPMS